MIITRKVEFDYGHRLQNHPGKCSSYHGHRGVLEVSIDGDVKDSDGMVMDFSELKRSIDELMELWDHVMLVEVGDPFIRFCSLLTESTRHRNDPPPRVCICDWPPTAENMAREATRYLIEYEKLPVVHVRLYETPNCWADWSREDQAKYNLQRKAAERNEARRHE